MRITYDPAADAIYVRLAAGPVGLGETEVTESGVIVDTDAAGRPRGYEFLSVRDRPVPLTGLPATVAAALADFLSSGVLLAAVSAERDDPDAAPASDIPG